jgi:hypothetical protein
MSHRSTASVLRSQPGAIFTRLVILAHYQLGALDSADRPSVRSSS